MASHPGMKPMLSFTNIPSRAELLRPRRRRKVVTPKIPRVKSICLSQEEVVPDMKWVSPQFEDYSQTLTKAVQPHCLGSLPFIGEGKRKPKNKLTVIRPSDARGRRRGGVGKASARVKKSCNPSKDVHVRKPLQKVNENSVDSSSESDWDSVSAPLPNQRAAAISQQLSKTSRSDMQQTVPCTMCIPNTEKTIQMQLMQDFNGCDPNNGGLSQESTQVMDRGKAVTCAQSNSMHTVEESYFQSHLSSQSSFVPTTEVVRCNKTISKAVAGSEIELRQAIGRKNMYSGKSRNLSRSHDEHKMPGSSSQNMDQTSRHLQVTDPPQQSSNHSTRISTTVCNYPLNSEQNLKPTASHMPSTSTDAPSVAGLPRYSTSTAAIATGSSRTCLQPKQQGVCDLNQMVSTMNIEDKNSYSLVGIKLNRNPDVNATFSLTDFHPKFASTPYTKRATRHGIVCHTPLTIGSTPSKPIVFQETEHDGHNADSGPGGRNEDVTVWAPETPAHLMVSLQRGRERCRRHSCTGGLCVIDDTLG